MRFVYSVVRFVPDPARGEFVNIGAIVGSEDSSEWQVRQIENPVRARTIDDHRTLDAAWSFLDRVGREIDEFERGTETLFYSGVELSENWLHRLYVDHRNIVQLSQPAPMVASSADEAINRIFEELVLDPSRIRHAFLKKHAALAALRAAYREHSVEKGKNLRERATVRTENYREKFDFAVTNGQAVQLSHTWSFQIPDQEHVSEQVKAWGWTVREVQRGGGRVYTPEGLEFDVPKNVDLEVVYVPPADNQDAPSLGDAVAVFEELGVKYRTLDRADEVGLEAHRLLQHSVGGRLDLPPA